MSIQVTCPSCQSNYQLSDALQGKNVRCKKCGEQFRIGQVNAPLSGPTILKPADPKALIQPSPATIRDRPPTAKPHALEEDFHSQPPRKSSSTLKILLIVFGSIAVVLAVVCAGIVSLGYWATKASREKFEEIQANIEANAPAPVVNVTVKPPANMEEALEYLRDANMSKRQAGAQWLARGPRDRARQDEIARDLIPLLSDPNSQVRLAGMKAMRKWASKDTVPALVRVVQDEEFSVWANEARKLAMQTLGELKDERGVGPVAARLLNFFDREEAARALIAMGPMVENTVLTGLSNQDAAVRKLVCVILAEVGTKASLTPLKRTGRSDPDPNVAAAALLAVNAISARPGAGETNERPKKPDPAPAKDSKPDQPADKKDAPTKSPGV